jgi:hypothetical protein
MKPTTHVHTVPSLKIEQYLHSKIHLQLVPRDNLTVTFITRLLLEKLHSCGRCKRRELLSYSAKGGEGPSDHRFTISTPSTYSAEDEGRGGMPTISQEVATASVMLGD